MKKFKFRAIKLPKTKALNKKKQLDLWMYGYYACSSLCMVPTIDLSNNNNQLI